LFLTYSCCMECGSLFFKLLRSYNLLKFHSWPMIPEPAFFSFWHEPTRVLMCMFMYVKSVC
jgi:hypothetical protein